MVIGIWDISNMTGTRKKIHDVMQYINRQTWVTSLYDPAITKYYAPLLITLLVV